jgi:dimethylaniline monooxygenase (N-oxide forming)
MHSKVVNKKKIAVIGAGISGLAAAKAFKVRGHEVLGFEQSKDLGGVWEPSRSYPGVHTQTSKSLYRYSDAPMPASLPEWPSGAQVHSYLQSYADKHQLQSCFEFGASVESLTRNSSGQGWTVTWTRDGKARQQQVDFVAVCTGQFSQKKTIAMPEQEHFAGQVLHSSEYTDPSIVRDRHVVVIGGSKSATDICVNALANGARQVHMVYRRDVWRVPYRVAGFINFKHLFFTRFQEAQYRDWAPRGIGATVMRVARPLSQLSFKAVETILKLQLSLRRHNMVPDHALEPSVNCSAPIVTPGFFDALDSTRLVAHRSTVSSCDSDSVVLANGQRLQADVIVQATGWVQGFPFLADEDRAKLIDANGQYRLHRFAVNPDLPSLGFVGANSSFYTTLTSQMVAEWLVRFADGQLAQQPSPEDMHAEIDRMARWRMHTRPAASDYGGLCVAPFHYRHFDDLLTDMGAARRNTGWLRECFSYPRADAYEACLASTPAYQVT